MFKAATNNATQLAANMYFPLAHPKIWGQWVTELISISVCQGHGYCYCYHSRMAVLQKMLAYVQQLRFLLSELKIFKYFDNGTNITLNSVDVCSLIDGVTTMETVLVCIQEVQFAAHKFGISMIMNKQYM